MKYMKKILIILLIVVILAVLLTILVLTGWCFFCPGEEAEEGKICVNSCGDNVCQEVVCQGTGCPCAETEQFCPQDCSLIIVSSPQPDQEVESPLLITGQARGNWFFEASFPVKLYDENNNLLASTPAQAKSDWMTNDFVPFEATLEFTKPASGTKGRLVLQKDNPSGLPQYDDSIEILVIFK